MTNIKIKVKNPMIITANKVVTKRRNNLKLAGSAEYSEGSSMSAPYVVELTLGENPAPRLDKALASVVPAEVTLSRSRITKLIAEGAVTLAGEPITKLKYKAPAGSVFKIVMPPTQDYENAQPENIPLDIVFEDEHLIIVNKPAGMVVHPGHGNSSGTLVNGLIYHVENLPTNSNERPGLVHRIDKDTSGLLVVAKTEFAMAHLSKQFFDRKTNRKYIALAWGNIEEDEGTIEGNIGRSFKNRLQMDVFPDGEYGKHAVTHFKVLERLTYVTLVECKLETGRTHQIRAHFKHFGHTLFNDERYGGNDILKGTTYTKYKQFVENCFKILPRQALHAKTLGFRHPITKEMMQFDSEIPEDMSKCLHKWKTYTINSKD